MAGGSAASLVAAAHGTQQPVMKKLLRPAAAATARVHRPAAAAAGAAASVSPASKPSGRQARSTRCLAASTEQGRERRIGSSATGERWAGSSTDGDGWSGSSTGAGSADPLLRSITQCSTARELHQLLLRHSGELGGREVAAALEVTARRRLLEPAPMSSSSSGGGGSTTGNGSSGSPLAPLLVQLADRYAAVMEPASLTAAAWGLAALQLAPARPVMRRMHDLAQRQLPRFAPSQLCTLLWAGGSLEPGAHSPLLPALAAFVRGGMSLALFSSHDLAYLSGREGGSPARDISLAVVDECRSRLREYQQAEQQARGGVAASRKRGPWARAAADGITLALPPPPFTPTDAAMLLTGLAQQQLRVAGVVQPLLRQCEAQLDGAAANDVARILIALGDLMMEVDPESMAALLSRVCKVEAQLSPQQVAAALWACLRIAGHYKQAGGKLATMALRHYIKQAAAYRAVDTIGVLWGASQLQHTLPDEVLAGALQAIQPELGRQSTAGLSNLLTALGKHAELRSVARASWLEGTPAGQETVATAAAVLDELARRMQRMPPAELSAAAAALATSTRLAAALPRAPCEHVAALRSTCAAAAAANEMLAFDVAQLATAAATLRWTERGFVDALAFAIEKRVRLGLTTSEVFSQAVWALASLAPSRYSRLFTALAITYASKMQHPERLPAHIAGFQAEERTAVLSAFAAVAQAGGLSTSVILGVVASVNGFDLRTLPAADAVPLLLLAAEARVPPDAAVVQACCRTIQRSFPRLSRDALCEAHAALSRMCRPRDELVLALERHLYTKKQMEQAQPRRRLPARG
ncbi:hypothetical protein ABPG75_012367 [Micractinium tetrahymenae]